MLKSSSLLQRKWQGVWSPIQDRDSGLFLGPLLVRTKDSTFANARISKFQTPPPIPFSFLPIMFLHSLTLFFIFFLLPFLLFLPLFFLFLLFLSFSLRLSPHTYTHRWLFIWIVYEKLYPSCPLHTHTQPFYVESRGSHNIFSNLWFQFYDFEYYLYCLFNKKLKVHHIKELALFINVTHS